MSYSFLNVTPFTKHSIYFHAYCHHTAVLLHLEPIPTQYAYKEFCNLIVFISSYVLYTINLFLLYINLLAEGQNNSNQFELFEFSPPPSASVSYLETLFKMANCLLENGKQISI